MIFTTNQLRIYLLIFFCFFNLKNSFALETLSYSGRLVQANGAPVTVDVNIRAELAYTDALGTPLCTQDISNVKLTNGVFHVKLNLNCTSVTFPARTLTQVLSQVPAGESVAIRITDLTHSKQYSYQALHALPSAIVAEQLPQMTASTGDALIWNGTKWWPSSVGTGNGTVLTVNSGTGLTGGPISTSGTISIANLGVGTAQLANNAVTAAKINAGEITNSHISGSAAIDYSKLNIGIGEIPQDRINGLVSSMSSLIEDVINDAVTGKAPSQNAVYDALALKAERSNITQNITAASVTGLTGPIAGSDAANKTYVDNAATTVDTRVTTEVATLNTSLGNKYDKSGGVITGDVTLNTQLHLKGGANAVTVKANAATVNYVLTLPTSAGTSGYVLQTDGSGNTSWVTPAVGSSSITDGSIVDADIHASAAIAQSKILNLSTDLGNKEPTITAGTTAQYYRGDKTFVDLATDVRNTALTGFTVGANSAIVAADSTLDAFKKVQGQIDATNTAVAGKEASLTAGSTSQYYRGDKSWQTLDGAVVVNTAAGNIAATNVQNAINELDSEKQAKLISTSIVDSRELRFYELTGNGTNYTSLKAPDALGSIINYVLPTVAPTAGQVLSSSAAGVMSWISLPTAPVSSVHGRTGAVTATAGDYLAAQITNTAAGTIAATNVQAALDELATEKQSSITAGTTAQYYRGDKTFVDFGTDVRGTALTGYAVGTNTALSATDTTLVAFQNVQGQINATNTAVAGKEPTIATGTTAQYIRGDKTLSTFATDAINSVLSSFAVGVGTKPAVTNTDTVVGAFGKVQKTLNDINADYVSKTADQTINGNLKINSLTGFITVPDPLTGKDAANKDYVDSFGQWTKNVNDIYRSSGNVGIGLSGPTVPLEVNGRSKISTSFANVFNVIGKGTTYADATDGVATFYSENTAGTGGNVLKASSAYALNAFVVKDNGNVGIGTASPTTLLHLVDNKTDTAVGAVISSALRQNINPASASSSTFIAGQSLADVTTAQNVNVVLGTNTVARNNSTAAVTTMTGSQSYIQNATTGTIVSAYGSQIMAINSAGGTITNTYGVNAYSHNVGAGAITNAIGIITSVANSGAGTIDTGIGLQIGTIQATNKFSIYASDATAPNYFAGNVGVGTAVPTSKLDVVGGQIKNDGFPVKTEIGYAEQTASATVSGASWVDLPGATLTFTLTRAMTVKMEGNGSVGVSAGATYKSAHCGFRFVINGTPEGSVTWGDVIAGVNGPSDTYNHGWWTPWTMKRRKSLAAGTYTIKLQMAGWVGTDSSCLSDLYDYSRANLEIEGW